MSSQRQKLMKGLPAVLAALAVVYTSAAGVSAQCPLCRAGLEKAGDGFAKALNTGIFVLLIPPVAIFCTIFAAAYRKVKGGDDEDRPES